MFRGLVAITTFVLLVVSAFPARAQSSPPDAQPQTAALLPAFHGDLARAGEWNRYTISASLDLGRRTLAGRQQVFYTNRDSAPLDRVYFYRYPNLPEFGGRLSMANITANGQPTPVAVESGGFALRVSLPRPLAPGESVTLAFDFSTIAPASPRLYGAFNREDAIFALASAYPLLGIVRGGVWQTARPSARGDFVSSETSLYDVTLTAPTGWTLATTGVIVERREEAGRQTARIVSGPQREFTITAARMPSLSAVVDGTRVVSYFRPGSEAGARIALDTAVAALRAFNKRFGPYPLAELDIVPIDIRTFLGVEYPGLIMIAQRLYADSVLLEQTVAHEVGHQWWFSIVGNDPQAEPWLDEGLTSYAQVVYQEEVRGWEAAERELELFRQRYLEARRAGRDAAMNQPATRFRGNYVAIVYAKGALFFQALRERIGDPAFDRFLKDYYAANRYNRVSGPDLLRTAETACTCELDSFYRDWIETAAPVVLP
jgi:hypothetical protein